MKHFIIFLLLLPCLYLAQKENFTSVNRQIQWQKVYETSFSQNEILSIIKNSGKFTNIFTDNDSLTGSFSDLMADYKGAGSTTMGTTIYVQNSSINANFKIDFKEGKYRVTITNILLNELMDLGLGISNTKSPIENYTLKNGKDEFRKTFEQRDARIYNYTFTNFFDFSKYRKSEDNW